MTPGAADLVDARRNLHAERLALYIAKTVDAAPELTSAQRERLTTLLALASSHPEATPNAANAAATTATTRPSCTKRSEERHASAQ